MKPRPNTSKLSIILALSFMFFAAQGCAYLKHRGEDALDVLDIGITLSYIPGFAVYGDFASVLPGGVGWVDGYFLGWGGGQVGFTRHFERSLGLLVWGKEDVGWREFDKSDPRTYNHQMVGVLGFPTFPFISRPGYYPACIHYVHIGFIGVVANARYTEMIDFVLGWTTLDIAADDGRRLSKWVWRSESSRLDDASDVEE